MIKKCSSQRKPVCKIDFHRIRKGRWGMAGELKEENLETANTCGIQNEGENKKHKDMAVQKQ